MAEMMESSTENHDFAPVWAVHAERDQQPWLRGWAKSKEEAEAKMAEYQTTDDEGGKTSYWVVQMTRDEVAVNQAMGVIPDQL